MTDISSWSLIETAERVASGEVSAEEVALASERDRSLVNHRERREVITQCAVLPSSLAAVDASVVYMIVVVGILFLYTSVPFT